MLTPEDLKAIDEVLKPRFERIEERLVGVEGQVQSLEETMNIKLDAMHEYNEERFDRLENMMVTKDYLDRKLAFYVKKPV